MSFGDSNKFSIPTIYKGILMRSKLETKVALFLDYLNIEWEYEPKTFLLSSGIYYKPDFFLTKHNQWIEVKGVIGDNNLNISEQFVNENNEELILISADKIHYFEIFGEQNQSWMQDGMQIGRCCKCESSFFTPLYGSYHCRKCGNHEGDHDIIAALNSNESMWGDDVDMSNIQSIKQWIKSNRIKI